MSTAGTTPTAALDRVNPPSSHQHVAPEPGEARALARDLTAYREPSLPRGIWEIAVSITPLALLWIAAWVALEHGFWWAAVLIVPAAGFVVRLFMIQHDCGHGAFFRNRTANDWVGRVIGVLTMTPYAYWRQTHAVHHATSGHLDKRGLGAIEILTTDEYRALPAFRRLLYRLYRHPAVLFGVGPAYMFLLQQRLPVGLSRAGPGPWLSAMGTNLALAMLIALGVWRFGPAPFLVVVLPTLVLAGTIGVWLFFVQHQFEQTYWASQDNWDPREAALRGSSYYDLPAVLRWFTANIGVHHVHHLNSRIPFYRMGEVLRDHPRLKTLGRITLAASFKSARLALWDPVARRMVSFRQAGA